MSQEITFIIPVRNNQKYALQAYKSIRKYHPEEHYIVLLDDASTDKTWEWIQNTKKWDEKVIAYQNEEKERVGHTVLYDKGVELAPTEIVSILHSDMVITENYVKNLLKHLRPGVVVSATRIEPPLHPPGPEKFVKDFGMEPDEFAAKQEEFDEFVKSKEKEYKGLTSEGIFAPWAINKSDFIAIGGHDLLFAPMELEDSDIFNRMLLAGYEFVQSRDAFVYHMTCRGSRFKDGIEIEREIPLPDGTIWYKPKDSEEYLKLRYRKFREWWRKWHTDVLHDQNMKPVVPNRYETAFIIKNVRLDIVAALEPWCDVLYTDDEMGVIEVAYYETEHKETMFDLKSKFKHYKYNTPKESIVISFDAANINNAHYTSFIKQIPLILDTVEAPGTYQYDIFTLTVNSLDKKEMVKPWFKNVF
jgi:glycosyltransferase involved in cell wall biosynthesis